MKDCHNRKHQELECLSLGQATLTKWQVQKSLRPVWMETAYKDAEQAGFSLLGVNIDKIQGHLPNSIY